MLKLQTVRKEDHDLLYNINQKYLYEMTNFYDDPMDEKGNLHYGHFEEYFSDPKRYLTQSWTAVGTPVANAIS